MWDFQHVLTLQQIVLSKNLTLYQTETLIVLTLQQIVLSKNRLIVKVYRVSRFDFTTNCSF